MIGQPFQGSPHVRSPAATQFRVLFHRDPPTPVESGRRKASAQKLAEAELNIRQKHGLLEDTPLRFAEVKAERVARLAIDMNAASDAIVKERLKFHAEQNRRREAAHYRRLTSAPRRQENAAEHEIEEQRRFGETVEQTKARLQADLEAWEQQRRSPSGDIVNDPAPRAAWLNRSARSASCTQILRQVGHPASDPGWIS
jgi:hypothetical protein